MQKFAIRGTTFDLSDDAALVLRAYVERLDFYAAKGRITDFQKNRALDFLRDRLLEALGG